MHRTNIIVCSISLIFAFACTNEKKEKLADLTPPKAKKIAKELTIHNHTRTDQYYWLNERENPEVINYLEKENEYYQEFMKPYQKFEKDLFEELKSRVKENDESVPYFLNGYWYQVKYQEGKDYPIYVRKKEKIEAAEEVIIDVNELAEGHEYFNLSGLSISPNNKYASFGVDRVGRRKYTLQVKDLEVNEILPTKIELTTGGSVWANDNKTIFYTRKDDQTLRSNQVFKHQLGSEPKEDKLVFQEDDETFISYVYKTKSKEFIVIGSTSTTTDDYQILNANQPEDNFKPFAKRKQGVEYNIEHYKDHFYITTNLDGATNFKLMKTPIEKTSVKNWQEVIPHKEDTLLEGIDVFNEYLVTSERYNGLNRIRVMRWDEKDDFYLPSESETYTAYTTTNPEFDTHKLRFAYNSLTQPASVVEFDMQEKTSKILKEQEVPNPNFDKDNYISERVWATASDGTKIPVSLVYKKGVKRNGKNPLLQYAYGSYGATIDPYFSTSRISLLDRGFIYAIAHIRGGEYLGRQWYEDGKMMKKKNTFTDFIDVSHYLIDQKYTSPEHLYAMGGSAGGLLMGAVINSSPELYHGVISAVPFVDVVTTMLDDSIPLTTGEYDEWGNPNEKEYYEYMLSYSPYDQVKAQNYPNLLVTTGLHDSQVQYWEPAKWVAKLRELKTDDHLLFLDTNMKAGHGGASGRFEALKEVAKEYIFLFHLEGINE
ncbi:S9 family peptidase [Psychroflexus maritimus]|uniref:Proline-specific endopeptidase n=1 Tax=Psychroflexus maritimus TaxID=2714865 RepID=A0A967E5G2_9FLAO|nr:S9 family peptidase [Psychroflexus maritimus]NGZ88656.1 S9 family peptidase [Psychroflexus maritimus]